MDGWKDGRMDGQRGGWMMDVQMTEEWIAFSYKDSQSVIHM